MRNFLRVLAIILIISAIPAAFGTSCSRGYSGPVESIRVAYSPFEATGLIWIAKDQNFFSNNGLDITLIKYDTGGGALNGMIKGEADMVAGTADYPTVLQAFNKAKIQIIATIDKADFIYLVGRKDRGIEKISDLKGKRIGTTFGSVAHFYTGRLLELNSISMNDVTLVDLKTPEEWVNSVANGDIDAVVTAQPYANAARDSLGGNAYMISAQAGEFLNSLVITSDAWLTQHHEASGRFLKALVQAENYVKSHPTEAKAIIQTALNFDAAYMDTVWSQNQFSVSLDQSLVLTMEDEARWMISNNLTTEKTVPNFLDYIYVVALKEIKPEAVKIVR